MAWDPAVTALIAGGLGGGGLSALVRVLNERRAAARDDDREDLSADDAHWTALIEAQTRLLVDPLQQQVDRHARRISELEHEIDDARARYRRAVRHIDLLLDHITQHTTADAPPPPSIPSDLANDL